MGLRSGTDHRQVWHGPFFSPSNVIQLVLMTIYNISTISAGSLSVTVCRSPDKSLLTINESVLKFTLGGRIHTLQIWSVFYISLCQPKPGKAFFIHVY